MEEAHDVMMSSATSNSTNGGNMDEEAPCLTALGGSENNGKHAPAHVESDDHPHGSTSPSNSSSDEARPRCTFSPRLAIGLFLLTFIGYVIVDTATIGHVREGVRVSLAWIEDNPVLGFFLFALVYVVATVLFIPGSLLTLGAGFVFAVAFGIGPGIIIGTLAVFVGASLGAIASFLLARYLLQGQATKLSAKYAVFEALDAALRDNGLKIFALLRLSPIIPFNAINYLGGVSSVSLRDYSIALIAILPGTILYVFLGASAGSLADSATSSQDPTITIVVVVVGLIFGVLAIWMTTRYARQELDRVLEERKQAADAHERHGPDDDVESPSSIDN